MTPESPHVLCCIQIARAAPLIVSRIMLKWVAKTDREKAAAVYPGAITYSILIATHALNWVLIVR